MFYLSSLFLGKGKKIKKNSFLEEKLIPLFLLSLATRLKAKWTAHMFCTVENKFFFFFFFFLCLTFPSGMG